MIAKNAIKVTKTQSSSEIPLWKEMYIAGMLSHAYLNKQVPNTDTEYEIIFHFKQESQLYKELNRSIQQNT